MAKKLLEIFSQPFGSGDNVCSVGVSIGVAIYPDDAAEVENLISCADAAMYEAKEGGKNSCRYWSKGRKNPGPM